MKIDQYGLTDKSYVKHGRLVDHRDQKENYTSSHNEVTNSVSMEFTQHMKSLKQYEKLLTKLIQ